MTDSLARVAHVIDEFTVVLNVGSGHGIQVNDRFLIYGTGEDIVDPDTGESLGFLEIIRGRVKVEHVQERISTARTSQTIKIPGQKRTIERKPNNVFAVSLGQGPTREEIEENHSIEDRPLNGAAIGDYAKPY